MLYYMNKYNQSEMGYFYKCYKNGKKTYKSKIINQPRKINNSTWIQYKNKSYLNDIKPCNCTS